PGAAASAIFDTLNRVIGPPRSDANTNAPSVCRRSSRNARNSSPWIGCTDAVPPSSDWHTQKAADLDYGNYDAPLSDDAHGLGVVGGGRGSAFVNGAARAAIDVPLQAGTLSKAVGAYGGYLCASKPVIDLMRTRARTFIYSTGLPPAI